MPEIVSICIVGVLMALLYSRTERPKLYAFLNAATGAVSLIVSEMIFAGSLSGVTMYSAALSVILGVPGTAAHRLFQMIQG